MPLSEFVATISALGEVTLRMFGSVKFYSPLKFDFMTDGHMFFETRHGSIAFITLRTLVRLSLCFGLGRRDALALILPECAQHILQLLSCL